MRVKLAFLAGTACLGACAPLPRDFTTAEADDLFRDRTVLYRDWQHGNQIEYYAPNGIAYLWYPGNQQVVPSRWSIPDSRRICFQYPSQSYNPVTGGRGGKLDCRSLAYQASRQTDRVPGDVFGLSRSPRVPRVLQASENITLPRQPVPTELPPAAPVTRAD